MGEKKRTEQKRDKAKLQDNSSRYQFIWDVLKHILTTHRITVRKSHERDSPFQLPARSLHILGTLFWANTLHLVCTLISRYPFTRNVAVTKMHWCEYTPPAAADCRARSSVGMSDKLQVNRASTRESASFVAPESVLLLVAWWDTAYFGHRSSSERTFWQGAPPGDYKGEIQSCMVYLPRRHGPGEELAKSTSLSRRQVRRMFSLSLFSNNLPWPKSVGV